MVKLLYQPLLQKTGNERIAIEDIHGGNAHENAAILVSVLGNRDQSILGNNRFKCWSRILRQWESELVSRTG